MRQLEELADHLLREGVAYRHVRRYVEELRCHVEDAAEAEEKNGASAAQARDIAWARVGRLEDLARVMGGRHELRSIAARHPILWGGVLPVMCWALATAVIVCVFVGIILLAKDSGVLPLGGSHQLARLQQPADIAFFVLLRAVPVVIGALMLTTAIRQRSRLSWSIAGLAALAGLAGVSEISVRFAAVAAAQSSLNVGLGASPETAVRVVAMLALMLTPLLTKKRLTQLAV